MSRRLISLRHIAIVGAISLLGACAETPPHPLASNPPPVAPGPRAIWYSVSFDRDSHSLTSADQTTITEVIHYIEHHPGSVATIIGRTDTVGTADYNMHLSHQRADAVRDALVYDGQVAADRVETRWTGEGRQDVATANNVAAGANRVVDIAIH